MKFVELDAKTYREFWKKSPQKCFLSAPEMAEMGNYEKILFFGVEKQEKLVAAIMIRGNRRKILGYNFYAPRGFLADYDDFEVLRFFTRKLREKLKKMGGYSLKIEPNVEFVERDLEGKVVEGAKDAADLVGELEKMGWKRQKYAENFSQIEWEFVLPLKGKSEEQILADMKSSTKRCLKQAISSGVEVEEVKMENLGEFYKIMGETSKRKGFGIRDFEYFKKLYEIFAKKDEIKVVSAVLRPKKCYEKLVGEKEKILAEKLATKREENARKDKIKSLDAQIAKIQEILDMTNEERIVLSSGMFLAVKPEVLYLAGGNADKYIKMNGQYILQWEMIKYALKNGFSDYNFYGIPEDVARHPEKQGVYEFKKGFSGRVVQLLGAFELPLSWKYWLKKIKI